MKKLLYVFFLLTIAASGQDTIFYEISFPNRVHHEAEISVRFTNLTDAPLQVYMSRSSPGRYALHEFAKNVYNVKAFDENNNELEIMKPDPYSWEIPQHKNSITIRYTLFGDHADGTYTGIDDTHAHLNMPATFMWGVGMEDDPVEIKFNIPENSGWKIATQLFPTNDPEIFEAAGLQYFMDSPTELSNFILEKFEVSANGKQYKYDFAIHHQGTTGEAQALAKIANAIVLEEISIFGEPADYDNGKYTFIADYLPYAFGDGMEHRNSTIMVDNGQKKTHLGEILGTISHEFFHSWNMERIRARAIEPFDFTKANMSGELWFGEGFTRYYDRLVLARIDAYNIYKFCKGISFDLNTTINSPGRSYSGPVGMSFQAPFTDAATLIDEQNKANTFISYYYYGAAIGLGLDLSLRVRFHKTLDDLMKLAWQKFGKANINYTNEDIKNLLAEVSGDKKFADSVFQNIIYGSGLFDYEYLLSFAGLSLRKANRGKVSIGKVKISYKKGKAVISDGTLKGSPVYNSGLDRGDRLIKLDNTEIKSKKDIDSVLIKHKPGDEITIEYEQRGEKKSGVIVLEEDKKVEVVPYEQEGMEVTEAMQRFRKKWLGYQTNGQFLLPQKVCPLGREKYPLEYEYCPVHGDTLRISLD